MDSNANMSRRDDPIMMETPYDHMQVAEQCLSLTISGLPPNTQTKSMKHWQRRPTATISLPNMIISTMMTIIQSTGILLDELANVWMRLKMSGWWNFWTGGWILVIKNNITVRIRNVPDVGGMMKIRFICFNAPILKPKWHEPMPSNNSKRTITSTISQH